MQLLFCVHKPGFLMPGYILCLNEYIYFKSLTKCCGELKDILCKEHEQVCIVHLRYI